MSSTKKKKTENKKFKKSLFIFRRGLRLRDNIGLIKALENSDVVIPVFIFTPEQVSKNLYKSNNAVQFMCESLTELDNELRSYGSKLHILYGDSAAMVKKLINVAGVDAVFMNVDYTPYAKRRDAQIHTVCKKAKIAYYRFEDYLLMSVRALEKTYQKFTPYWRRVKSTPIAKPSGFKRFDGLGVLGNSQSLQLLKTTELAKFYGSKNHLAFKGGRKAGLARLKKVKNQKNYPKKRNDLTYETTQLSAYIKFGCVSIREVYWIFNALGGEAGKDLKKQLWWREFYYNIIWHFGLIDTSGRMSKNKALKSKYDKIRWASPGNSKRFKHWCEGRTGFPVVDAAMRQMNATGFMHNRGRLIVSNFLVKVLLIDWRLGERYFAQQLVDYDPAVNNGNWQWSAGSGADSQPYFRVFNPWLQSKRFDSDGSYIKRWVPELNDVDASDLHKWNEKHMEYPKVKYPKPMIDYSEEKKKVLEAYKKVL